MSNGHKIISLVAERQDLEQFRKKHWEGIFDQYLDLVRDEPRVTRNAFQRVYERHAGDVVFLGLDVGVFTGLGTRASALRLLEELGVTYPAGAPPDRSAVVSYGVVSMPTTVFFNAAGEFQGRLDGAMSESRLAAEIDELLAPS